MCLSLLAKSWLPAETALSQLTNLWVLSAKMRPEMCRTSKPPSLNQSQDCLNDVNNHVYYSDGVVHSLLDTITEPYGELICKFFFAHCILSQACH